MDSTPIPHQSAITGALAIDSSGLPLGSLGELSSQIKCCGNFSGISKLARQLTCDENGSGSSTATVMIEKQENVVLIKEYHGRVVVFQVPTS